MGATTAMKSNSDQALIFLHVPKTAGITLHRIIEKQYRPDEMFTVLKEVESIDQFRVLPEDQRAKVRVLKGHFFFGVHELLPRPSTYFTVLRDPIDRVISHYYYVLLRDTDSKLHRTVSEKNLSLEQFLESGVLPSADNGLTRYLSGVGDSAPYGKCPQSALELAKSNLENHFSVVGLTDRFDETLILLKRAFGWKFAFYKNKNITSDRPPKEKLSASTLALIERYNELDRELYRFGKQRFEETLAQQGASFAMELHRLKALSTLYRYVRRPFASKVRKS